MCSPVLLIHGLNRKELILMGSKGHHTELLVFFTYHNARSQVLVLKYLPLKPKFKGHKRMLSCLALNYSDELTLILNDYSYHAEHSF